MKIYGLIFNLETPMLWENTGIQVANRVPGIKPGTCYPDSGISHNAGFFRFKINPHFFNSFPDYFQNTLQNIIFV